MQCSLTAMRRPETISSISGTKVGKALTLENWKLKVANRKVPSRTVYSRGKQVSPMGSSPPPLPALELDAPRYTFDSQKRSNPNVTERFKSPSPVRVGSPIQLTRTRVQQIAIISNSNRRAHLSLGRASITQPSQPKAPSPLIREIRHETPLSKLTPRHQRDTVSWRAYKKSRRNVTQHMSPRRTFQEGLERLKHEQSEWKELESKEETISFGQSPERQKVMGLDGTIDTKPSSLEVTGNLTPSLRAAQHTSRIIFPKIKQQRGNLKKKEQDVQTEQQGRKLSAQNYSTLGTQKNVEKFEHYTRMATQPYYYNKKGEIKSNEFSLQKHKPSCRLSLAESIDQLEQVESGEILPKEATMSQTMRQQSVSPRGDRLMNSIDRRAEYNTERLGINHASSLFPGKARKPVKNQYEYVESKLKRLSLFPSDSRAKFQRFLNEDLEFASPKPRDMARSSLYMDSHTSLMKRRYPGRESQVNKQNLSLDHAPSFVTNQRFVTVILNGPNPTTANLNRTVVLLKSSKPFDAKKGSTVNSSLLHKQREFREFLLQCTKLLGLNRLLKHVFLPSGQQLYSLEEVPQTAEKLYVSHLAYFFSGMASPRPAKKEDMQNKITNLERARLIQGASHRKVTQAQTPSLQQIMPLSAEIREEDTPQQASNLSLMIRDLVSRQKRDIAQAEDLYTKKRNIREIIKKSSNDAQLQFELRSIQDQEEMRSAHGSPTIFSRQSQNKDQQAQTVDQDSGDIISSHPKETALSIATSEVYYPSVNVKRRENKFAQYIQSQSQKSSSMQGSKGTGGGGGTSASFRLGSNYSRKYQTEMSEYEGQFEDPLFDRELYNSRNRHKSVRNEVIREECTQEEMLEQMSRESRTRQQILSSAFNSIRLKLEMKRDKQEREVIMKTAENVGEILSRNHDTLSLSNGSEWLQSMIERIERGDRVMDMLSEARSSDTEEESADRSPVRHSLINKAKALKKVLLDYKQEVEFKIEPFTLDKQPSSEEIKDFVQLNKEKFNQSEQAKTVEKRIGSIVTQNIPKLQLRSNFSRRELHALHSQFKTLCRISLARHPEIIRKVEKNELAIDIQTFISCARGIMNFGFHQDQTLERIFHTFDSDQNGIMDWEEFLLTMKLMTTNKMEQRVGLFFKAAESAYGASLDFNATKKLCEQSLARYMKIKSRDPVMEDLVQFFASYIFESLGVEKTASLPLNAIQKAIFEDPQEELKDMLLLFSCSDD